MIRAVKSIVLNHTRSNFTIVHLIFVTYFPEKEILMMSLT